MRRNLDSAVKYEPPKTQSHMKPKDTPPPKPLDQEEPPEDKPVEPQRIIQILTFSRVDHFRKIEPMIIPSYNSDETQRKKVIVNRLSTLNEYDFAEPHRHDLL